MKRDKIGSSTSPDKKREPGEKGQAAEKGTKAEKGKPAEKERVLPREKLRWIFCSRLNKKAHFRTSLFLIR